MSKKETGGPAFPYLETGDCGQREGMTMRDYFAAKAMNGLLAAGGGVVMTTKAWAENAYAVADAMLEARK